jgi:betaine reductase
MCCSVSEEKGGRRAVGTRSGEQASGGRTDPIAENQGCQPARGRVQLLRVVHYINQFFAGVGGEETARTLPYEVQGPIGPGRLLERLLDDAGEVVATVVCGDTYFAEHPDEARDSVLTLIRSYEPDLVVAGPAFISGRYGIACATIAAACEQENVLAITGMHPENPAWDDSVHRVWVFAVPTSERGGGMAQAMENMVRVGLRRVRGETLYSSEAEWLLPRGVRVNVVWKQSAAARAIDGLLTKLAAEPFSTEIPLPTYQHVTPSRLERSLSDVEVA